MRHLLLSALCITQVLAQDISQINEDKVQDIMAQMQKMQTCLSKIDMSTLEKIQEEAMNVESDIKVLCKKGQRDKAQKIAIDFSKRFMSMQAISQMKICTKLSSMGSMLEIKEKDYTKTHVCDGKEVDLTPKRTNRISW